MGIPLPQNPGIGGLVELTSSELALIQSLSALGDPGADRILFWDESANAYAFLTAGSGLTITDTTITATGTVDGSGTTDELTYWVDSNTLGSLSTATYPSLTELSYVKGVTSAIQTQLNAKQATLVSGTNIKTINGTSVLGSGDIVVSGGTIDGSGTTNELTYWVDTDTVGSLAVATYPSLTEISYVKGVTSAIQTQLNGKEPTITDASISAGRIEATGLTLIGRVTVGTGSASELTPSQIRTVAQLSSSDSPQFTGIELGHASDTTIARVSAGVVSIEGVNIVTTSSSDVLSNKTLTAPKFADLGFIADANGNELLIMDTVTSAVNEITLKNAATTTNPGLTATGGDTNVGIDVTTKGTGTFNIRGNSTQPGELRLYEDTDLGTNYTAFKVGTQSADISYVLPTAQGGASTTLTNDGSGNLSWAAGGSANPGWDFVSYTTASATTDITVSSLNLATDGGIYMVIVKAAGTTAADYRLQFNAETAGYTWGIQRVSTAGAAFSFGTDSSTSDSGVLLAGSAADVKSLSAVMYISEMLLFDGTNTQINVDFSATGSGTGASNDAYEKNTGTGITENIEANITSLTFLKSSGTANWKVWVFKAATS